MVYADMYIYIYTYVLPPPMNRSEDAKRYTNQVKYWSSIKSLVAILTALLVVGMST